MHILSYAEPKFRTAVIFRRMYCSILLLFFSCTVSTVVFFNKNHATQIAFLNSSTWKMWLFSPPAENERKCVKAHWDCLLVTSHSQHFFKQTEKCFPEIMTNRQNNNITMNKDEAYMVDIVNRLCGHNYKYGTTDISNWHFICTISRIISTTTKMEIRLAGTKLEVSVK